MEYVVRTAKLRGRGHLPAVCVLGRHHLADDARHRCTAVSGVPVRRRCASRGTRKSMSGGRTDRTTHRSGIWPGDTSLARAPRPGARSPAPRPVARSPLPPRAPRPVARSPAPRPVARSPLPPRAPRPVAASGSPPRGRLGLPAPWPPRAPRPVARSPLPASGSPPRCTVPGSPPRCTVPGSPPRCTVPVAASGSPPRGRLGLPAPAHGPTAVSARADRLARSWPSASST